MCRSSKYVYYFSFFPIIARSHFIDSPPTYNVDYDYKNWEAYSNLSYYTRTLPPLPKGCPAPLGVSGKYPRLAVLNEFLNTEFMKINHIERCCPVVHCVPTVKTLV